MIMQNVTQNARNGDTRPLAPKRRGKSGGANPKAGGRAVLGLGLRRPERAGDEAQREAGDAADPGVSGASPGTVRLHAVASGLALS